MSKLKEVVINQMLKTAKATKVAGNTDVIYSPIKTFGLYIKDEGAYLKQLANITDAIENIDFWIDNQSVYKTYQ